MDDEKRTPDDHSVFAFWRWNPLVIVLTVIILLGVQMVLLVLLGLAGFG